MFTTRFRTAFYSSGCLGFYTGFLLGFLMMHPADFYPLLRQTLLKLHIASVAVWLFTCGMLFSIHVIPQLQAGITQGRRTGILLIALIASMTLSGYALQVLPWAGILDTTRWLHVATGTGFVALLVVHLLLTKTELRTWIIMSLVTSILLFLPLLFLEKPDTFPDEIKLVPQTETDVKKNP